MWNLGSHSEGRGQIFLEKKKAVEETSEVLNERGLDKNAQWKVTLLRFIALILLG
jgi:hypothetical protein